ncbi:MAG: class I SAM-dependent methyltransferase [Candidatus Doudnabacteria bacterium]
MKDNWHHQEFATDWDTDTHKGNPSRLAQLDLMTSIIVDNYERGNKILDLGFGTGQVEDLILKKIPHAEIVGVDSSDAMIEKAKKRLEPFLSQVTMIKHNLEEINSLVLPENKYQFAITCQVLHELAHEKKKQIFKFVSDALEPGGMYFLLDRFKIDAEPMFKIYKGAWNWQERQAKLKSNKTFDKYKEQISTKEDYPASLEDEMHWMNEAGFKTGWLHLQLDRGLIAGVKI